MSLIALELRWRIQGSGQPWTTARYAPDLTTITLTGLIRGETYDGEARYIADVGPPSPWAPVSWMVATTPREGTAALPPVSAGNVSSRWVSGTEITWSATDTTCTVNVSAGTLQVGEKQISYGASSVELTGTAEEVRTVYLYYDDPRFAGGTRTLGATTDSVASMSGFGRVLIDQVTVTFDIAGGTGTTGGGDIGGSGGGAGPDGCPSENAWMVRLDAAGASGPVEAGQVRVEDQVRLTDGRYGRVSAMRRIWAPMLRVVFGDGHSLTCSRTAQLERDRGGYLLAPATVGARLAYERDGQRASAIVARVEDAGMGWVIHFTVENSAFLVGDDPEHLLGHHNLKPG